MITDHPKFSINITLQLFGSFGLTTEKLLPTALYIANDYNYIMIMLISYHSYNIMVSSYMQCILNSYIKTPLFYPLNIQSYPTNICSNSLMYINSLVYYGVFMQQLYACIALCHNNVAINVWILINSKVASLHQQQVSS